MQERLASSVRYGFCPRRFGRAVVIGFAAAVGAACSSSSNYVPSILADVAADVDAGVPGEAPGSGDAGAEPAGLSLPDTSVGRQLAWLLGVINDRAGNVSEAELRERFSPAFLQAIQPEQLQQTLVSVAADGAPLTILQLGPGATDTQLQVLADARGTQVVISLNLEAGTGLIAGLLFETPEDLQSGRPESWEAVEASVAGLAPRSNYLVASIEGATCMALHASARDDRLAIGSTFKLYVLAELSRQVEAGRLGWDTPIVIRDALKSLPSGQLQDQPEGTELSVLAVATPMIAISDNTAADHLLDRLGRENVEAALAAFGHGAPDLNIPFLSTRELFLFKLSVGDADVASYLAADVVARRTFLEGLAGQAPSLADAVTWVAPRRVDAIEWFASASDLCQLMAALDVRAELPGLEPIAGVLSTNPGLPINPADFPYIAFKGGSEPGVLNLTWLVHGRNGARYFVSIGLNDTKAPIADENAALRTALGIFDLLAASSD